MALTSLSWSLPTPAPEPHSSSALGSVARAQLQPGLCLAMGSVFPGLSPYQPCSLALALALPHHHGPAKDHRAQYRSCQAWPRTCLITPDLPGEFDLGLKCWGLPFPAPLLPVLGYPLALGVQGATDPCCSLMVPTSHCVCPATRE